MLPSSRNRTTGVSICYNFARVGVVAALFLCLLFHIQLPYLSKPTPVIISIAPDAFFPLSDFQESLKMPRLSLRFWEYMRPGFQCPPPLLKKEGGRRTKHVGDGAKWLCDLSHLANLPTCLIYSFGVDEDLSFEAKLLDTAPRCHVYAYDPNVFSVPAPLSENDPRVHFHRLGLGGQDQDEYRTLRTLMRENGGHQWIDVLKVDIEGDEFEALERILEDFQELPFGRLNIEMHLDQLDPKRSQAKVVELIQRLEAGGLRLFHVEWNWRGIPANCCAELAFVNVKKLGNVVDLATNKELFENFNKRSTF